MNLIFSKKAKFIFAGLTCTAMLCSPFVKNPFLENFGPSVISKEVAMKIAQDEVSANCDLTQNDLWTKDSCVTEAFPIEIDGIKGTSYYECKVETQGSPAGYVLVNVNKTDGLIVESAPDGNTVTEQYQKELGRKDFAIKRYNWIQSVAMDDNGKVLSSKGFDSDKEKMKAYMDNFRQSAAREGCNAALSKLAVNKYYKDITLNSTIKTVEAADWQNEYAELKHILSNGWHTPQYIQYYKSDDYPIGCGPTAWSIVYGYWAAFKGKNKLFDGLDIQKNNSWDCSYNSQVTDCMSIVANAMGTSYGEFRDKKYGLTWPWDMEKGIKYAKNKGYTNSRCTRYVGMSEYSKFDYVKGSLNDDRPCILTINNDGAGIPDHYVVIEAANKSKTKYAFRWHDRDVKYLVNWGDGTTRKWIYVRDWGKNQSEVYPATSMFTVDIN